MNLVFSSRLLAAKRGAGVLPKKDSEAGEGQNKSCEEQQLLSLPLTHPTLLRYKPPEIRALPEPCEADLSWVSLEVLLTVGHSI